MKSDDPRTALMRRFELLLPVAVPMHEHGKVAVREGGLLVRDRVERDIRICDDPLAIALCE